VKRDFASDNNAGVHPEVLAAIAAANVGHVRAYGDDPFTERATAKIKSTFGANTDVYFVYGGTGANVLGLKAVTQPYHAVLCALSSHVYHDECGAPERFTGCKLWPIATPNGKLRSELLEPRLADRGSEHHSQPRVVSITQSTEVGTVYQPEEVRALADFCHAHELLLHMDGARLFNAAASLGTTLSAISSEAGVDVLSLGGTKNGLLGGEAVLFLNGLRAPDFKLIRKQGMQLTSKMRFTAAQFDALFTNELWQRNAAHANAMAQRLAHGLAPITGIRLAQAVEANAVFAHLPTAWIDPLLEHAHFYDWEEPERDGRKLVRLMASFDTTTEDVDAFVLAARRLAG
jgi:threonine aldolase